MSQRACFECDSEDAGWETLDDSPSEDRAMFHYDQTSDKLTDMERKLLARAEKAEQERDEAQALANTLHRRLDVWVERAECAERELAWMRHALASRQPAVATDSQEG